MELRIDISKDQAKGLGVGDEVSISVKGEVTGVSTFDLAMGPDEKKSKPKINLSVKYESVSINGKEAAKKVFDKGFEKMTKEDSEDSEDEE